MYRCFSTTLLYNVTAKPQFFLIQNISEVKVRYLTTTDRQCKDAIPRNNLAIIFKGI